MVVRPVDVDERQRDGELAEGYLARVVTEKLAAARALPWPSDAHALLVADTMVTIAESQARGAGEDPEQRILHKPVDDDDGRRMLRALAGRAHHVTTRFVIASHAGRTHTESVVTRVQFRNLHEDEITAYLESGEGRDKAGGYAIQGRAGAFISRVEGSYGAVVGLPPCEVTMALRKLMTTAVL